MHVHVNRLRNNSIKCLKLRFQGKTNQICDCIKCYCHKHLTQSNLTQLSYMVARPIDREAMKDTLGERPRSAISLNKIIKELRGPDTIRDYVRLMDLLIQGDVSAKVFKDNRETTPMREWVTVSDEAFLLLCVENYATVWENEVRVGADEEIPEGPIPMARYTGKNKGTRKSWSKDGMKLFNHFMERVFLSREAPISYLCQ